MPDELEDSPSIEEIKNGVEEEFDKMLKRVVKKHDVTTGDVPPEIAAKIDENKNELIDHLAKWIRMRTRK